jgi:acyl-CoA synthetase (AMP-forming)/AMP-acid ligase II
MADQAGTSDNYVLRALPLLAGYGDGEAIVHAGRRISYRQITAMVMTMARALAAHGVQPGSGVAVMSRNHPEEVALQLALHLIGCRTVWIASYAPYPDQASFAQLAKAEVLIYDTGTSRGGDLAVDAAAWPRPVLVLCLGAGGQGPNLLAELDHSRPVDVGQAPSLAAGSPQSLFYSGGTTGRPKLIQHGQGFYQALLAIAAYYRQVGEPPMRFLSGSSLSHVSGQLSTFLTLFEGGTFFINAGFEPAQFLATIEAERISSAFLTPPLLARVVEQARQRPVDTSSLRYLNVGGAAASPALLADAIKAFGPVVRIVYGSCEAPLITDLPFLDHDPEHPERLSSCGLPFAGTGLDIRDANGKRLPAGATGEVWLTGPLLMQGYWEQPGLTGQTMVGGWLRTGDVGYLDADGYLYLVDRLSDMIITGSISANVYARPVEDALASHPQVLAAAVIGVPDETYGEAVHAFVVPAPGAAVTAGQLRALVVAKLNDLYAPKDVEFVSSLPMTMLDKVDKKALRARYLRHTAPALASEAGSK